MQWVRVLVIAWDYHLFPSCDLYRFLTKIIRFSYKINHKQCCTKHAQNQWLLFRRSEKIESSDNMNKIQGIILCMSSSAACLVSEWFLGLHLKTSVDLSTKWVAEYRCNSNANAGWLVLGRKVTQNKLIIAQNPWFTGISAGKQLEFTTFNRENGKRFDMLLSCCG